ncbi:MAG: sodium:solute symporter, partial [Bacteroidaceae bacterium]|nr:sodium:solute symporter [Bacteroidaceae bacterium]
FLAPFLYGLYWKRTSPAAVWASFIVGVGVMCGCMYGTFTGHTFLNPFFSSPINAGVLAMVLGLVVVPIVSAFTPVKNKEAVKGMFACYNRTVTVRASTSLRDDEE